MRRLSPTAIAAILGGAILLLLIIFALTRQGDVDQDKLTKNDLVAAAEGTAGSKCGSQQTYDLIKREIFRQAADTRGSAQAAFDRIAATATVRMERPLLKEQDERTGMVRCLGNLSIDLPPGLSIVGGRRSLSAAMEYVVQSAADGSGDVVMIEGADAIIVPLATLASIRGPSLPAPTVPADPVNGQPVVPDTAPPVQRSPPPQAEVPVTPPPQAAARPSFNCRFARTRGEIAVCRDSGLASLDRQMASQYVRAAAAAGPRQRAQLRATRDAFLRYRDRCPSDACVAAAYRDRMREIDDIMAGRWRPGR